MITLTSIREDVYKRQLLLIITMEKMTRPIILPILMTMP